MSYKFYMLCKARTAHAFATHYYSVNEATRAQYFRLTLTNALNCKFLLSLFKLALKPKLKRHFMFRLNFGFKPAFGFKPRF